MPKPKGTPVLNEEGLVIINGRGKVLKRPHKPVDFRTNPPKKKPGQNKGGRPKGYHPPAQYIMETTTNYKLQKYKKFMADRNYDEIELNDITYAVSVIRRRKPRHTGGKPLYKSLEDLQTCIQAYWDYIDVSWNKGIEVIPDVEGVAMFLGMSRGTLLRWEATDYCGYGETIAQLRTDIASVKKQLALKGKIAPIVFATDFNNNHDYKQRQETIVVPENPFGNDVPLESIKQRYLADVAKPIADFVEGSYKEVKGVGVEDMPQ